MNRLPERPDVDHLKRQAKDLLALYRRGDTTAMARLRAALPAAAGKSDHAIAGLALRLHDAQSCIAREYGFPSWTELRGFVEARRAAARNPADAVRHWLRLVYAGDIAGGMNGTKPAVAARVLATSPALLGDDPYLACAVGDLAAIRRAIDSDPAWASKPGGPLNLPPLIAVTHSSLARHSEFRDRLHAAAKLLLAAGADANQAVGSRWPPASLEAPSQRDKLSALYGAAGQNRDPALTRLLLNAGADPNDGESLYHSLESLECTRLLLAAGARIIGTNAIYRVLDLDDVEALRQLLAAGADPNESTGSTAAADWPTPLLWAIRRRRSRAHIAALLDAGAEPTATTADGCSAYVLALRFGLGDVAELLRASGIEERVSTEEAFVAACGSGDEDAARRIQADRPDLPAALTDKQLRLLPELAANDCVEAVRLMVELGWPIATRGGDWEASALNHAVFKGNAALTRFLLERGATWTEEHGFGDNACGTLGWASVNEPVAGGDWVGCARALVEHGMPAGHPDPAGSGAIVIDGRLRTFSDEVEEFLAGTHAAS